MSKKALTILIIVLAIIIIIFGFWYFNRGQRGDQGEGTNFDFIFNPFGKTTPKPPTTTPPADVSGYVPPPELETQAIKLRKVSSMPIAGFGIFMKERFKEIPNPSQSLPLSGEGNNPAPPAKGDSGGLKPTPPPTEFVGAVRYVARATGNIYQTFADVIDERKFSTTIIPKVHEAYFANKGESVIMRYLKEDARTIETFVGALPKELLGGDTTDNNEIKGIFLPEPITDVSVSPDTQKIFYLFPSGDGVVGVTADFLGSKKVQIFDSPFTEWLPSWPNVKTIALNTKSSGSALGYLYFLDTSKKAVGKILGDINGLTTLTSPDGKLILYGNGSLSLNIFHTDTRSSDLLGVRTLAEKCVWAGGNDILYCAVPNSINGALYPDAWYKGEVSFADAIWKIDLKSGTTTMLVNPVLVKGEEIDGIKLALDESENYLFFVNKKDSFLWELELK